MIQQTWQELEKLFGPKVAQRQTALILATQKYAQAILSANDSERIRSLGKRHLMLAAEKRLSSKQLTAFLGHAIKFERTY